MMLRPLVQDLPTWALAILVIGGFIAVSLGGLFATRPLIKRSFADGHNDVAGFLFATVGVIYAVVMAFLIFAAWDAFGKAEQNVSQESSALVAVYRDAAVFPPAVEHQVQSALRTYAADVEGDEWRTMQQGEPSPKARRALDRVYQVFARVPLNSRDQAVYQESLSELNTMSALRTGRILDSRSALPDVFWLLLILGGMVTVAFSLLFYMENLRLQALGTAVLAAIVGGALLLILTVNYPFSGDVHVSPEGFTYATQVFQALAQSP